MDLSMKSIIPHYIRKPKYFKINQQSPKIIVSQRSIHTIIKRYFKYNKIYGNLWDATKAILGEISRLKYL